MKSECLRLKLNNVPQTKKKLNNAEGKFVVVNHCFSIL